MRSHFELAKEARFKMAKRVSIFAAFVNVLVASSMAAKCPGNANYTLTWKASWTRDNHPNTPLPSGAHFSNLIGCTHGSDYIMWRRGMNASAGVKSVAELGQTGTLKAEIEAQKSAGKVWQLILPGYGLGAVEERTGIPVKVTSNFSRVSLISMLAPSPDWFIGIDSHDLCDNGQWRKTWDVTMLPPYDSGTDSEPTFIGDQPTVPPVPIFRINNTMEGAFKANNSIKSLGEFRFMLQVETDNSGKENSAGKDCVNSLMIVIVASILAFLF